MTGPGVWPLGEKPPWLVRIRPAANQDPVGAGMLCPDGHIVTCAHVLSATDDAPAGPVYVEFQHAAPHDPIPAVVVAGGWHPARSDDSADVAVLELHGTPPAEASPAPLRTTAAGVLGHTFRTYGYPRSHARLGTPAEGRIVDHAGAEWLKLEARSELGQTLVRGFSGAPVWDVESRSVIGIAVAQDDKGAPRTAYAIPCEALVRYWPPLAEFVDAGPSDEDRTRAEALARLLDLTLTEGLELPRIIDTDVYRIGVSRSKWQTETNPEPPYVPRADLDAELADALAHKPFVLAVGDSTSGKTRALAEALRATMPGARLIVPRADDAAALPALAELALPVERGAAVLWLDDLDLFLRPNGLDQRLLDHFAELGVLVVGTISSTPYATLLNTTDSANRTARTVLNERAHRVHVPARLTSTEQAAAERLYQGEDFSELGIGAQAVAAPALTTRYDTSRAAAPSAWAVLRAVIDWRRIGIPAPMPETALRAVFPAYLALATVEADATDEQFAEGLAWARKPVAGAVALLSVTGTPDGERVLRAFDYIVAVADGQDGRKPEPIPEFLWTHAIAAQRGENLLYIAFAALGRKLGEHALAACRSARDTATDPPLRARATLMLGELEAAEGNADTARDLLEEALASGVPDVAPLARAELGALLAMPGGEPERARSLLEETIAAGDAELRPFAQLNLGALLMNSGDHKTARPLLEEALASGDAEVASHQQARFQRLLTGQEEAERNRAPRKAADDLGPRPRPVRAEEPGLDVSQLLRRALVADRSAAVAQMAQASLGGLLVTEGELDGATVLLEAALRSGNAAVIPLAQVNLAGLLLQKGDVTGATELFETAAASGNPAVTSVARVGLGWLLVTGADSDRGRELLREVAQDESDAQAARAACLLGDFGLQYNILSDAVQWYETAQGYDHPEWTPYARTGLGIVAGRRGETALAVSCLRPIAASGHPEHAPRAADMLGDVLAANQDLAGAESAYRDAISSGHSTWAPIATIDLAKLLFRDDRTAEARTLLEDVASADGPYGPAATGALGDLLSELGEDADAAAAYRRAIASGHPQATQVAQLQLAAMLAGDDPQATQQLVEAAAAGPDPALAAQATNILGDLLGAAGDADAAIAVYQRAIEAGHPVHSAIARVDLALLHLTADEPARAEPLLVEATRDTAPQTAAMAHFLLGTIRLWEENWEKAEAEFSAAEEFVASIEVHHARLEAARHALVDGQSEMAGALVRGLIDNPGVEPRIATAARAYADAAATGQPALAFARHGEYLFEQDDLAGAEDMFVAASEDPSVAARVWAGLGMVRLAQGRRAEATDLLRQAVDAGDASVLPQARRYLASALLLQGHRDEARTLLEAVADTPDSDHRPRALLLLGQLASLNGPAPVAKNWFEQATAAGDPEVAAEAEAELVDLTARVGPIALPPAPLDELPAHVLTLLATIADAEDQPAEASYWRDRARQ